MQPEGCTAEQNNQRPGPRHPGVGPCKTDAEGKGEQSPDLIGRSSLEARRRALQKHRNRPEKENLAGDKQGDQAESEFQIQRSEDDVEAKKHRKQPPVHHVTPLHSKSERSTLCQPPVVRERRLQMQSIGRLTMKVLFVCVGNSCRSQMAEGLAKSMGVTAASAGTHPAAAVAPHALTLLESRGIDTTGMHPQSIDEFQPEAFDKVVSMGCGVHCPAIKIDEDWGLEDPVGSEYAVYERTAEEIERRLKELLAQAP